jgi:cell division protein FtsI/penicillin-binding protein 2
VAWWNHSRRFAAIRDNLPQQGEQASSWTAHDVFGGVLRGHTVVPLDYGYVNAGQLPQYFNNWLSVSGQEQVVFRQTLKTATRRTLNLQVIGQPDIRQLARQAKVTLKACQFEQGKTHCNTVSRATPDTDVYRIRLTLAANRNYQLELPIKPALNSTFKVDGLPIHLQRKAKDTSPYQNHQYAWQPVFEYKRNVVASNREQFRFKIAMSDGTVLFDSLQNYPTQFTRDYGLLSLIGYDSSDRLALAGMIARSKLGKNNTEVRLTLNANVQKLAYKHLQQELKQVDPKGVFNKQRRAAVVLINPKTGAVLAAANYPNPPADVHRWDRLSFSKLYPTLDPFGVAAWQGLDSNNTPGSTFKMVTSLAALHVAEEGNDTIDRLVRGLNAKDYFSLTRLAVTRSSYDPDGDDSVGSPTSKVKNAGNASLLGSMPHHDVNKKMVYPRLRNPKCAEQKNSRRLGLSEAVRDSLNIWFARLAVMMDKDNLASGGKETHLVAMADRLGFGTKLALAQTGSPLNPLGKLTRHKGRGSVLTGFTGNLTLKTYANSRYATGDALQRLSQNSFGQGVTGTPLQMARVASTVATGYLPQPYVLQTWAGKRLDTPDSLKLAPDNIDLLRTGMKAVPEVGTARRAFAKYYPKGGCQVYGKTGTAQVATGRGKRAKRQRYYSAWFTGWHETDEGTPDIAFACMVSHTYIRGHDYGGDVCGPIVARILRDMDKQNAKRER